MLESFSCTAADSHKCTLANDLFMAVWNLYDDSLNGIHSLRQKNEEEKRGRESGCLLSRHKWLVVSEQKHWCYIERTLSPFPCKKDLFFGGIFGFSIIWSFSWILWLDKQVRKNRNACFYVSCEKLFKIYLVVPICLNCLYISSDFYFFKCFVPIYC